MTTNLTEIICVCVYVCVCEYYEQLYVSKLDNLDEMDKFL